MSMTEGKSRFLLEKGLSFFGVVTASLSHEINNAIAIIGELSGLLDDLLAGAGQGRPLNNEKLQEISGKIGKQVKKGQGIIKRLNRFAHSIDEPVREFDLKELLEQITTIAERFAFLKGVNLEAKLEDDSIMIISNPFSLQQAIFTGIEVALRASKKNDAVTVALEHEGDGARVVLTSVPIPQTDEADAKLSFLSILAAELGGSVNVTAVDDGTHSITLSIPRLMPTESIHADGDKSE
jgi:C4-dicarboxylate-specific signal transduction histidine kinase